MHTHPYCPPSLPDGPAPSSSSSPSSGSSSALRLWPLAAAAASVALLKSLTRRRQVTGLSLTLARNASMNPPASSLFYLQARRPSGGRDKRVHEVVGHPSTLLLSCVGETNPVSNA